MHALYCSLFANANRGRGGRSFKVADFLPDFSVKEKESTQTPEQMMNILQFAAQAGKGK